MGSTNRKKLIPPSPPLPQSEELQMYKKPSLNRLSLGAFHGILDTNMSFSKLTETKFKLEVLIVEELKLVILLKLTNFFGIN